MMISKMKRYILSRQPTNIEWVGDRFLYWDRSGVLYSAEKGGVEKRIAKMPPEMNPLGITVRDKYVYFIDGATSSLFKMNLKASEPLETLKRVFGLKEDLEEQIAELNTALLMKSSRIKDIHLCGNKLLIAVQAGYSSGVYRIDIEERKAEGFFFSGTDPRGITSDPKMQSTFLADGRYGYLFEYDRKGKDRHAPAPLPIKFPCGLSFVSHRHLFVGVSNEPLVIGLLIEEDAKCAAPNARS